MLANDWHFILVCKPYSHQTLYEWLDDFKRVGKIITCTQKMEWSIGAKSRKLMRKVKSYISTVFEMTAKNIVEITEAGRARWKIENNNTLKTKGYSFKHNFGHG
jgi:REP element-mobilizing transposase RayT